MSLLKYLLVFALCFILLGFGSIYGLYKYVEPELPDVNTLKDVRLQTPMQIHSADGQLIAQYGEMRRIPLSLEELPSKLIEAFIATEDSRFKEHHGVDPMGMFRALNVAMTSGHASQGASTITQQLARNFFLSPERTLIRKIKEVFLAIRIEQLLSKKEILELYLNKIYLGHRAYGVGAAAQVYFGKTVNELSLAEIAMIAGLPKAPSILNPLSSPERALTRRNVVLARMRHHGYISRKEYETARVEPIKARWHGVDVDFSAPYVAEMARQEMLTRYGERAYTEGYKVYTTVTRKQQISAEDVVRNNVIAYDRRHGYRGKVNVLWKKKARAWSHEKILDLLNTLPDVGPLFPAVVFAMDNSQAKVLLRNGQTVPITMAGVKWARPYRSDELQGPLPKTLSDVLQPGQQIWVQKVENDWWLAQIPEVNSSLISLDPQDGAILALVGGFDFGLSKFNRATQAQRQVGSNVKPFLYAAALDRGLTLASVFDDAPISLWDAGAGTEWQPKNSPPVYEGPIRLRQGLGQSKNVVMVRIMSSMGVEYAADYMKRFGFPAESIVRSASLALGAASFTPLQVARGYAVIANGGFLVEPYLISKITQEDRTIFNATPAIACASCNLPTLYEATQKSGDLSRDLGKMKMSRSSQVSDLIQSGSLSSSVSQIAVRKNAEKQKHRRVKYAPHVISEPLSFLIKSALNSNIFGEPGWMGTAWRTSRSLKRRDVGGKTGTTNKSKDAWFSGYGPGIATTVWLGFDDHRRSLGRTTPNSALKDPISGYESGAKSAQPAWNKYMSAALEGMPEQPLTPPEGIVTATIDRRTGRLSYEEGNTRQEYFIKGTEPQNIERKIYLGSELDSADGEAPLTLTDSKGDVHELF